MSVKIWAFSESPPVANEVASVASAMAGAGGGSFAVVGLDESGPLLTGEEKLVVRADTPLSASPEAAASALAEAAKEANPDVILVGSTRDGKEIAARMAVKLGRPCASEVFGAALEAGKLQGKRNVFAGKLTAEVSLPLPCIVALKVGTNTALPPSSAMASERMVGTVASKTKLLERQEKQKGTVDLRGAKLIVSAGRGIKKKEDLALVRDLAVTLGGAIGCSRPLSADMGWLPEEHHIGLTGITVHPDLYLALGISGQLQHVAGIKDSKVIAAVNTDKSAPIFEASDYGVVGDLYAVIPAMLKELKARQH
ncbi:MAG TPA: electron transfer flavoprotein subunit alpha/FixB family protein [Nitrososphaerales archaeon]|nr:electron transfer flavoprotein subunit alpha/FixB family protein [Nitrososphaerales archaeon]